MEAVLALYTESLGPGINSWQCELVRSEEDVTGATQHQSMYRELLAVGARVTPKMLVAMSCFAAQSNTGVEWAYIRDLLLYIDQVSNVSVTGLTLGTLACSNHLKMCLSAKG